MEMQSPITAVKGVGEKTAKLFAKLNINTVEELIHYFPRDYEKYDEPCPVSEIRGGEICTIEVTIMKSMEMKRVRNLQILTTVAGDSTGKLKITWFNMPFLRNTVRMGSKMILRGRVRKNRFEMVMEQPVIYTRESYGKLLGVRQPVYGLTAGLSNKTVVKAVAQVLESISVQKDYLPDWIRDKYELAEYNYAINTIHFPKDDRELLFARKRLVFDEFFLFVLAVRMLKGRTEQKKNRFRFVRTELTDRLLKSLPYQLTNAQQKVWREIQSDLQGDCLMNRLVQGDVGSGKTILAVLALLLAAENGYQGAMMVPTEVLANQHFESISSLFEQCGIDKRVILLTGSMTAKQKRHAYEMIATHAADIIIGTHALIQERVQYDRLALVITDEQHRFGVRQREIFSRKGENEVTENCAEAVQSDIMPTEIENGNAELRAWLKEAREMISAKESSEKLSERSGAIRKSEGEQEEPVCRREEDAAEKKIPVEREVSDTALDCPEMSDGPHVLVMSATPIPRTLAIIIYGDLDISVVDELPADRLPIKNCVVDTSYRKTAYQFMANEITAGRQVYVICPMVEESEMMDVENVIDYTDILRHELPSSVCVEYLHGKMRAKQKEELMERFGRGEIHVLVSTTVIEVGVNVPNATVMMVENAERFGLAQLHQLRGRVGRGRYQSYCIFVNGSGREDKNRRLEILNRSNDGFYIASEDLKLRGPGDIFGIRQSGLMEFAIGDIFTDAGILKDAAEAAEKVLGEDFELAGEENFELQKKVNEQMEKRLEQLYL